MKRNNLSFRIVKTDSDKELAKEIVENHHSIEAVEHKQGAIQEDVQLLRQQLAVLHEGKDSQLGN